MSNLLDRLKQIVNRHEPAEDADALPRAAAILLIEMGLSDEGGDVAERRVIEQAIRAHFDLEPAELDELLAEAARQQRQTASLHEFTHRLRTSLAAGVRADLVEWLWKVAYADGRVDPHEEQLVRRLSDLLGVAHREFIRRKHRAAASQSIKANGDNRE
ncbi:MAG: TerB family tellurite resistance protein [Wenzhouxiangellaceae bacterium]|nr:TerB family tellurite resistance protein [Wenzhouxiangellaceae bacterium]